MSENFCETGEYHHAESNIYVTGRKVSTNTALCDRLIRLHRIDRLRAVFISHTHHDHVMDAPYIANKCGAKIYGSESAKNVALGGNVPEENIIVFQHGSCFTVGGFKIRILKSLHAKPTPFILVTLNGCRRQTF